MKRYQVIGDGNSIIKNDCSVDIPRYLTLNWLCDTQIELPNKQSSDVAEFIKINALNNEQKQIPLANKELNNQLESSALKSNMENSLGRSLSSQKSSPNIYSRLNTSNMNARRNILDKKMTKDTIIINDDNLNDPLPSLSLDFKTTSNNNKSSFDVLNFYDEKQFVIKDMTEQEQIDLAMSRSLVEANSFTSDNYFDFATSASDCLNQMNSDSKKKISDDEPIGYVDGNFDILNDSDDNDNHIVNRTNFDADDEDFENTKPKFGGIRKSKISYFFLNFSNKTCF